MSNSNAERMGLLENILDQMGVAVTYGDNEGKVLYLNRLAAKRPSKIPREVGINIRDCHSQASNEKVARLFEEFRGGRRKPHHYVTNRTGTKELVAIIPFFEQDKFIGCMSQIYPLEIEESSFG